MLLRRQVQEKPLLIRLQYKGWALLQCFFTPIYCTLKQPTFWLLRIWILLDYKQERNTTSYCNIQYQIILVQQLSAREKWRKNDSVIWQTSHKSVWCLLNSITMFSWSSPLNKKTTRHPNINPCKRIMSLQYFELMTHLCQKILQESHTIILLA